MGMTWMYLMNFQNIIDMAKNFDIEIRESFETKYLKVFLKNTSIIEEVRENLNG